MLMNRGTCPSAFVFGVRQRGIVLLISLMILVVLSMAGLALFRSVDTVNILAGNLAFQKSATLSAEAGVEAAIGRILAAEIAGPATLQSDHVGTSGWAYYATASKNTSPGSRRYSSFKSYGDNPVTVADWDEYWSLAINPSGSMTAGCRDRVCVLSQDAVGNTVSYTIQRLCDLIGDPYEAATGCVPATNIFSGSGNSLGSQNTTFASKGQIYYRITSRVTGPRNSGSYVQVVVAK